MKKNTKQEKLILSTFASMHRHCWLCGISEGQRQCGSSYAGLMDYRRLEIHHICKLGRKHEGWNLSRLCKQCHMLVEGHSLRDGSGELLPVVSNENVFWLKQFCDASVYDWEQIVQNWRAGVPNLPEKPDAWFAEQYQKSRSKYPIWFLADV